MTIQCRLHSSALRSRRLPKVFLTCRKLGHGYTSVPWLPRDLGRCLTKPRKKGISRPHLRNMNVRWFDFDLSDLLEMPFEDEEIPEFSLRSGDVLICEGGEPGRAAVWDERASGVYFQKAIHRVRFASIVDSAYFVGALRASTHDGRLAQSFTGTGIRHFTGKSLDAYLFPLPPIAEQHRI